MQELQEQDPLVGRLRKEWKQGTLDRKHFTMENDILKKKTIINGILYQPVVVPDILKDCLLTLAHNEQGHNGFRTFNLLKCMYHWKGMKCAVQSHCTRCMTCAKHNIKIQQLQKEHFKVQPQPMEFISMDLIGEFHPPSSKGNRYTLTAVCMITGFTFCIPIKSKKAEDVVTAYMNNICCVFGPSKKILTDNGTEFKNKMWTEVFKRLRTEHRTTPKICKLLTAPKPSYTTKSLAIARRCNSYICNKFKQNQIQPTCAPPMLFLEDPRKL